MISELGSKLNPHLPILDPIEITRNSDQILNRIMCLYACCASSYGFPSDRAFCYLKQEHVEQHLTLSETNFLCGHTKSGQDEFRWQVEALWMLTWATGYHSHMDLNQPCSNDFVRIFPDLKTNESSEHFRKTFKLRSTQEIAEMVDLAYCLHWVIRDKILQQSCSTQKDIKVTLKTIEYRRKALEWLTCEEDWETMSLDT